MNLKVLLIFVFHIIMLVVGFALAEPTVITFGGYMAIRFVDIREKSDVRRLPSVDVYTRNSSGVPGSLPHDRCDLPVDRP